MKRRTFISLMSVMAAAGVLTLSGCSSNSSSTSTTASGAASADSAAALKKANLHITHFLAKVSHFE